MKTATKSRKSTPSPLTAKQEAFALAYVQSGIAATAYREAYEASGMKPGAIYCEASRLLDNPRISRRVNELQAKAANRVEISLGRVLREYSKIAFHDIRKAFDSQGNLKPVTEIDDETASAISGIEFEEITGEADKSLEPQPHGGALKRQRVIIGRLAKIKLSDRKAALDALAKHLTPPRPEGLLGEGSGDGGTFEEFLVSFRRKKPEGEE